VRIGSPNADIWDAVNGPEILGETLGGKYDGIIEWYEVEKRITPLPNKSPSSSSSSHSPV